MDSSVTRSTLIFTPNQSLSLQIEHRHNTIDYHYLALSIIPIWTFVANGIVLYVFCREKSLRVNMANLTIASLTIADFCLAIFVLPFAVYFKVNKGWQLGFSMHLFWFCTDVFLSSSSIMNLCVISVYRYLAIAYPYRISHRLSVRHVVLLLLLAWTLCLLVALAVMMETIITNSGAHYKSSSHQLIQVINCTETRISVNNLYMMGDKPFLIYGSILTFYLPLAIMIFSGVRSIKILRQQRSLSYGLHQVMDFGMNTLGRSLIHKHKSLGNLSTQTPDSETNIRQSIFYAHQQQLSTPKPSLANIFPRRSVYFISTKERRAIRTLLIVLVLFVILWCPFFILQLIVVFKPSDSINFTHNKDMEELLFDLAWPGYVSSGINPVVYAVFHPEYNVAIKKRFKCLSDNRQS